MKNIFKYKFDFNCGESSVLLPCGAKTLTAQFQNQNEPQCFLWAIIDDSVKGFEERKFRIIGTGDKIEDSTNMKYLSTAFLYGGVEVYHIFEIV
jgi:hypothetical protein